MMEWKAMEPELQKLHELESYYRDRLALVADSDSKSTTAEFIRLLQGIERCIKMRIQIIREAGPSAVPSPDPGFIPIDLSKLSDSALREVEAALVHPESNPIKTRRKNVSKQNLKNDPSA